MILARGARPVGGVARGRRGFTLLEVMFAAIIGALVAAGCIAMLGLMDRVDRFLAERSKRVIDMRAVHMSMQGALAGLVMAEGGGNIRNRGNGGEDGDGGGTNGDEGPPRLLLELDAGADVSRVRAARRAAGGQELDVQTPQRLEVVLQRAPGGVGPELADDAETRMLAGGLRGAFELRPEVGRDGVDRGTWELIWRPIPPSDPERPDEVYDREDGRVLVLGAGIVESRWRVFHERAWVDEFSAVYPRDLPAYIELSVVTGVGIESQWLFEIGWREGDELALMTTEDALAMLEDPEPEGTEGGEGAARPEGGRPTTRPAPPARGPGRGEGDDGRGLQ